MVLLALLNLPANAPPAEGRTQTLQFSRSTNLEFYLEHLINFEELEMFFGALLKTRRNNPPILPVFSAKIHHLFRFSKNYVSISKY